MDCFDLKIKITRSVILYKNNFLFSSSSKQPAATAYEEKVYLSLFKAQYEKHTCKSNVNFVLYT